jgi:hypothetical protein
MLAIGIVLTKLSGMAARATRDLVIRRTIDAVVLEIRAEITAAKLADARGQFIR